MPNVLELMKDARSIAQGASVLTSPRFKEILSIARKHDLKSGLTPEKATALLQDLGATFVKLGQIASTHPDVLPPEYCEAFGKLRSHANPLPFDEVKAQVEHELGKPLNKLFASFDETPLGSASMAQVHRATLHNGTVVAVKVQRPGVPEQVTSDLAIMERLVDIYDLVSRDGGLSVKELVAEMVRTSVEELGFLNEASNLERFYANNKDRPGVSSPKCYRNLCTSAVLTEDYASSPAVEGIEEMGLTDDQREQLAYLLARNYMQQIMEDGFYHADPHAGNVLVVEGTGIEWIDFGMMGTLTASQRDSLQAIIDALVKGNAYGLKRAILRVATPTGPVDHASLLEMCESTADKFVDVDLESFDTGAIMQSFLRGIGGSGFEVEPFLMSLSRGLVTLEGTVHLISPKLNIMKVITEYMVSSFNPKSLQRRVLGDMARAADSAEALESLPTQASATLDMIQKGQVRVGFTISTDEKLTKLARGLAAALALAFVVVGLIIGSAILSLSGRGVGIGIAGIVLGALFSIFLAITTWKNLR